jgi:hypothetical protein
MIAIAAMIIDHAGVFLFPQVLLFRTIGRLSFPLFAWLIANGARHTKDMNSYLKRLFIFSLISQAPYFFSLKSAGIESPGGNVLITLFLGLLAIKAISENRRSAIKITVFVLCALAAQLIKSDYGMIGVLSIVSFYLFFDDLKRLILTQLAIYIWAWYLLIALGQIDLNIISIMQPMAIFSLIFIVIYNKKPGPKAKYLFYIFYPLQFLVFYGLKILLGV